jgi:RIO-like serine/threonine protein kinase
MTTAEVAEEVGAEARGLPEEEVKHALDGLFDARMVVWEARGEIAWRISAQGQDYLTANG